MKDWMSLLVRIFQYKKDYFLDVIQKEGDNL